MSLGELVFSDLFVSAEPQTSWYKPTPDSLSVVPVPENCHHELKELRQILTSNTGSSGFRMRWPQDQGGMRLRVERIMTAHAEPIFVCRHYRIPPGDLSSLGMPQSIAARLMDKEIPSGLVVFLGKAGAGKSTAAGSFFRQRLSNFGGVGWTVENPVELDLQGKHGKGWCYQTEVSDDGLIGPAIRQLMRGTPNLILIGELRDGRTVVEAITAALSGHLVVSTFHSGDLISGIARLARLAQGVEKDMGGVLADALKIAVHLSLHNLDPNVKLLEGTGEQKGTGTPPRVLMAEPLFLTGAGGDAARTMIRDGEFQQLISEIERQKRSLMMRGLP